MRFLSFLAHKGGMGGVPNANWLTTVVSLVSLMLTGTDDIQKRNTSRTGAYLTPQSRRGIFLASDSNNDGFVSEAEYVENRLITDEAKLIFGGMDSDGNNRLTSKELLASGNLKDQKLANGVFKALDTNEDGELVIPEYLRVWGRWARPLNLLFALTTTARHSQVGGGNASSSRYRFLA